MAEGATGELVFYTGEDGKSRTLVRLDGGGARQVTRVIDHHNLDVILAEEAPDPLEQAVKELGPKPTSKKEGPT